MRMARAFIASVPLGIVLVAALVVPLAVIPGTFGFDSWPSSHGDKVTESQVRLAPPKVAVVPVRTPPVPEPRQTVAVATIAPSPAPAPVVPARRATLVPVHTTAPTSHRGARNVPPRPTHQNVPQPQTPAQQREPAPQPSKNDSGILAGGEPPVAREAPTDPQSQTPVVHVPAPEPPQQVVPQPVQHAVPSQPCRGDEGGEGGGHGRSGHGGWKHGEND